jgi:hypothetical protein
VPPSKSSTNSAVSVPGVSESTSLIIIFCAGVGEGLGVAVGGGVPTGVGVGVAVGVALGVGVAVGVGVGVGLGVGVPTGLGVGVGAGVPLEGAKATPRNAVLAPALARVTNVPIIVAL